MAILMANRAFEYARYKPHALNQSIEEFDSLVDEYLKPDYFIVPTLRDGEKGEEAK